MEEREQLLEGEFVKLRAERVEFRFGSSVGGNGILSITNFRLLFHVNGALVKQVPLLQISKIAKRDRISDKSRDIWDNEQASTRNPLTHKMALLQLFVADSRPALVTFFAASTLTDDQTDEFFPNPIRQCSKVASTISFYAFPASTTNIFAFSHRIECPVEYDGWAVFDPETEFARLGIPDEFWRITYINHDYSACSTYPRKTCVPLGLQDWELRKCIEFRCLDRFPCLSWRDRKTGAAICRSAQPLTGIFKARNREDERLVQLIRNANSSDAPLYIVDTRPQINAVANTTKGAGYESTKYENCEVVFLKVENMHSVRKAYHKLREICLASTCDDEHWLSLVEQTRWVQLLSTLLQGARRTAEMIHVETASVLIHCSDGWDRTPQISSLAQIMLDPYYRTVRGFETLVEKEWCSFGHKFAHRVGQNSQNSNPPDTSEMAPIFMQFADAVWQMMRQFPTRFEFSEKLLLYMIDHTRSGRFGTFLFNCEMERRKAGVFKRTTSLWTEVNLNKHLFTNAHYEPLHGVLFVEATVRRLQLWESYFFREDENLGPPAPLVCKMGELQIKVNQLEGQLARMEEELLKCKASIAEERATRSRSNVSPPAADIHDGNLMNDEDVVGGGKEQTWPRRVGTKSQAELYFSSEDEDEDTSSKNAATTSKGGGAAVGRKSKQQGLSSLQVDGGEEQDKQGDQVQPQSALVLQPHPEEDISRATTTSTTTANSAASNHRGFTGEDEEEMLLNGGGALPQPSNTININAGEEVLERFDSRVSGSEDDDAEEEEAERHLQAKRGAATLLGIEARQPSLRSNQEGRTSTIQDNEEDEQGDVFRSTTQNMDDEDEVEEDEESTSPTYAAIAASNQLWNPASGESSSSDAEEETNLRTGRSKGDTVVTTGSTNSKNIIINNNKNNNNFDDLRGTGYGPGSAMSGTSQPQLPPQVVAHPPQHTSAPHSPMLSMGGTSPVARQNSFLSSTDNSVSGFGGGGAYDFFFNATNVIADDQSSSYRGGGGGSDILSASAAVSTADPLPSSSNNNPGASSSSSARGASALTPVSVWLWERDEDVAQCPKCEARFTLLNRRHHCRLCGRIFCATCSSKRVVIDSVEDGLPARVCDRCFNAKVKRRLVSSRAAAAAASSSSSAAAASASRPVSTFYQQQQQYASSMSSKMPPVPY